MEVCTAFQKMIQDLNAILGIPANAEIVDKENPKSGILLQLLGILGHVVPGKPEQFIHHIAVVMELTAVVQPASLIAESGCKVRFSSSGFSINTYIQAIGNKIERQDLLYRFIIVLPPVSSFQVLNPGILFHQLTEFDVGCVLLVQCFDVLRRYHLTKQLLRRKVAELRVIQELLPAECSCCQF
jgi:hypothetical protein